MNLPRYGLGNYVVESANPSREEQQVLDDLSRAGKRLMGFCRTNLFKRLESSGHAFPLSVERHVLRSPGRFRWVAAQHFHCDLPKDLLRDSEQLIDLLARWQLGPQH